jgi:hypothetical protein
MVEEIQGYQPNLRNHSMMMMIIIIMEGVHPPRFSFRFQLSTRRDRTTNMTVERHRPSWDSYEQALTT